MTVAEASALPLYL